MLACEDRSTSPPTETELISAVMARQVSRTDSLLQAGAPPNSRDLEGTPALIIAVNEGQTEIVKSLVNAGADINARRDAYFGSTALMEAGVRNDPDLARWLLDQGADLHRRDTLGDTPLNWAAYYGHQDLVALYLERGADWSVASKQGTAIDIAMHRGHRDLVRFFIAQGAGTVLSAAAKQLIDGILDKDLEVVKAAIEDGADPNQTDELGTPALVLAAGSSEEEILSYLLRQKADKTATNRVGETAMARAARFGHEQIVNRLLSVKLDPNLAGEQFNLTPIITASQSGYGQIIQELIASGANPNVQGGVNGFTPLMWATAGGHIEAVKALLVGGASPYIKGFDGAGLYDMLRYSNNPEIGALIEEALLTDE